MTSARSSLEHAQCSPGDLILLMGIRIYYIANGVWVLNNIRITSLLISFETYGVSFLNSIKYPKIWHERFGSLKESLVNTILVDFLS